MLYNVPCGIYEHRCVRDYFKIKTVFNKTVIFDEKIKIQKERKVYIFDLKGSVVYFEDVSTL